MEISVEYNNPSEVFIKGYKTYYFFNYYKEIIVNIIVMLMSLVLIIIECLPILGYILFTFSFIYLFMIWLLFYMLPINAIKKNKGRSVRIIINSHEIRTISSVAESVFKWEAFEKVRLCKNFIIIISERNSFLILHKENLSEDEYKWLLNFAEELKIYKD